MFPIVAKKYHFVVGVDTHAKTHTAVIINNLGETIVSRELRVTKKDIVRFIDWTVKVTNLSSPPSTPSLPNAHNLSNTPDTPNPPNPLSSCPVLFAVEGTSSYGETLTKELLSRNVPVVEVKPPKTKSRAGSGKTDLLDAELAALSVLRIPVNRLIYPRTGTTRKTLRVILSARRNLVTQQVMNKNTLTALLRSTDLGIDARHPLTPQHYRTIASWRIRRQDELGSIRQEAKRLATAVIESGVVLKQNLMELHKLVNRLAPDLLNESGVGPVSLAQIICSYSHKGRIHSAAAFAALAGAAPIPASSGNTTHHRLNHHGDRKLNSAINTIVIARMRTDQITQEYMKKRTEGGASKRDIRRSLKRYVARDLFKKLEACDILA